MNRQAPVPPIEASQRSANAYAMHDWPEGRSVPRPGPGDGALWRLTFAVMAKSLRALGGIRTEVRDEGGWASVQGGDTLIFAGNHQYLGDAVFIARALPRHRRRHARSVTTIHMLRAMGRARNPIRRFKGWLYVGWHEYNFRPIWVGGDVVGDRAVRAITDALESNDDVILFPSGFARHDAEATEGRPGAATAAARTGVRIVPVRIDGAQRAVAALAHGRRGGTVTVTFRDPIRVPDLTDIEATTDELIRVLAIPTPALRKG